MENPEHQNSELSSKNCSQFPFKFVPYDEGENIRLDNSDMLFINDNENIDLPRNNQFKKATSDGLIN